MANSARIDDLKKKFDENPRRYFAPLANEYRKAGDPEQAIAICREFLPQQPGHMSGHIVYGQALYDAQQLDEAKQVFDTALTLDPENLIALRYLGDIARSLGDPGSARIWYQRVLDADPRNGEIAALMTELANAPLPAPAEPPPSEPTETVVIEPVSLEGLTGSAPPDIESPEGAPEAPRAEPVVTETPEQAPIAEAAAPEPVAPPAEPTLAAVPTEQVAPPVASAPPAEELLDLDDLDITASEPATPEADRPRPSLETTGFDVERSGDGLLMPAFDAVGESRRVEEMDSEPAAEPEADAEPMEDLNLAPPAETPPPFTPAADPFATETMAELYRSQGHIDAALRVYRQLLMQRPDDADIQAHIEELEAAAKAAAAAPPRQEVPDLDASSFSFDSGDEQSEPESSGLVIEPPAGLVTGDLTGGPAMQTGSALGFTPTADAASIQMAQPAAAAGEPKAEAPAKAAPRPSGGPTIREFLTGLGGHVLGAGATGAADEESTPAGDDEGDAVDAGGELEVQGFAAEMTVTTVEAEPVAPAPGGDTDLEGVDIIDAESMDDAEAAPESPEVPDAEPISGEAERDRDASSGGSIDLMFESTEIAEEDQAAAEGLASAYGLAPQADEAPSPKIEGAPARRATDDLSLDSVFREPRSSTKPTQPRGFSFDKFFANPTPAMGSSTTETPPLGQPSESADDDIQQFNSWLDGLKKR